MISSSYEEMDWGGQRDIHQISTELDENSYKINILLMKLMAQVKSKPLSSYQINLHWKCFLGDLFPSGKLFPDLWMKKVALIYYMFAIK